MDKGENKYIHLICAVEGGFYSIEENNRIVLKNNQIRARFNLNSQSVKKELVKPKLEARTVLKMPEIAWDEEELELKLFEMVKQKLVSEP